MKLQELLLTCLL